jgi:hypothetical protein
MSKRSVLMQDNTINERNGCCSNSFQVSPIASVLTLMVSKHLLCMKEVSGKLKKLYFRHFQQYNQNTSLMKKNE